MTRLLRLKEILKITSLSKSTIYDQIQIGKFPQQIRIARRAVAWSEEDVDAWIKSKISAKKIRCNDEKNRG